MPALISPLLHDLGWPAPGHIPGVGCMDDPPLLGRLIALGSRRASAAEAYANERPTRGTRHRLPARRALLRRHPRVRGSRLRVHQGLAGRRGADPGVRERREDRAPPSRARRRSRWRPVRRHDARRSQPGPAHPRVAGFRRGARAVGAAVPRGGRADLGGAKPRRAGRKRPPRGLAQPRVRRRRGMVAGVPVRHRVALAVGARRGEAEPPLDHG